MFSRILLILVFMASFGLLKAQLTEDFNDGDFTQNPTWEGGLNSFIVNDQNQLQLNATEAGNSIIFTPYNSESEQEWNFYFKMNFSPSASNKLNLFFNIDNPSIEIANGYMIEVGETGSADALVLNKLESGNRQLIARGTDGALGSQPAEARVNIKKFNDGMWQVNVDYGNTGFLIPEFEFFDDSFEIEDAYFLIQCNYTSSRLTEFFFDDISVGPIAIDQTPPALISVLAVGDNMVELTFDEIIEVNSLTNLDNYLLKPSQSIPNDALAFEASPNKVKLTFDESFESGVENQICVNGVMDLSGNITQEDANFTLIEQAEVGDLLLNEILFNPFTGGSDFVEIINVSSKNVSLENVSITNIDKEQSSGITGVRSISAGEILAFSPDIEFLQNNYQTNSPENLISNSLPQFNQDVGNVSLILNDTGEILDAFDYDEDFHFQLIDNVKGVSLERISLSSPTNEESNWASAASGIGFATPGVQNSSAFTPSDNLMEQFELANKVFSPNSDGFDDFATVEYELIDNSFVSNVNVYDAQGRVVKELLRNEQLGTSGFFQWDGTNENGEVLDLGIYIIWIQLFSTDGTVSEEKLSVVLAEQLN